MNELINLIIENKLGNKSQVTWGDSEIQVTFTDSDITEFRVTELGLKYNNIGIYISVIERISESPELLNFEMINSYNPLTDKTTLIYQGFSW